jgi:hypothetical protein
MLLLTGGLIWPGCPAGAPATPLLLAALCPPVPPFLAYIYIGSCILHLSTYNSIAPHQGLLAGSPLQCQLASGGLWQAAPLWGRRRPCGALELHGAAMSSEWQQMSCIASVMCVQKSREVGRHSMKG